MKLLFDQNISFRISKHVLDIYSECLHVSDCGLLNKEDSDIWEFAKTNNFTIVTFDSDFYDISLVNGHPPKIIWIRTGNLSTQELENLIRKKRNEIENFLSTDDADKACIELEV